MIPRRRSLADALALLPVLCWLLLSVSRGVFFWQTPAAGQPEMDDYTTGNPLMRALLLLLMGAAFLLLMQRRERTRQLLRGNLPILLLFAFMLFSIAWSGYPAVSFRRFVRSCGTLMMAMLVLTEDDPARAVSGLFRPFLASTLVLSALLIHFWPAVGRGMLGMWIGLTYHKNSLGQLAALGALFYFWQYRRAEGVRPRLAAALLFGLSVYLLLGARSMTSLAQVLLGLSLFALTRLTRFFRRGFVLPLLCLPPFLAGAAVLGADLLLRRPLAQVVVESLSRDLTFTGRTSLWADVIRIAFGHPWGGYGYGGFWVGKPMVDLWTKYIWQPNSAHNGYLDVLLELGLAGLLLLGLAIVRAVRLGVRRLEAEPGFGVLSVVMLAAVLFNNLFEGSFLRLNHPYWFLFLLFALRTASEPPAIEPGTASEPRTASAAQTPGSEPRTACRGAPPRGAGIAPGGQPPGLGDGAHVIGRRPTKPQRRYGSLKQEAQSRRVSVCIITYRRPRYLQACLESLARLRFSKAPAPQLTVVVVDNDAEGGAGPLVRALGPAYPWRVDYAVEPRRGISWARNTALRLAQRHGDWIAFIDDDEIADPAWLDELLAAVEEYGVKVVTGPVIRLLPEDTAPWLLKGRFFDMRRTATGTREHTAKTGNVLFHQDVLGGDPEPFEGRFALTGGGTATSSAR